ncbi:hypothetical protein [Aeromicrobium endophyticum]|uniref:Uncharacterized protein n=1 Tax=Aeromicrobium endophyticum TaxID=2292704 RepID=A0A371PCC3_9ACTN|nr:hypothetical protein [Aeromicrobium endophyticum]REK73040.1 hypothetical protein DX116_05485 [Aeromicrobium endophyticum]
MRTSILTRSVISIASLAIGSVALAAAPASAAAPSGVTRDLVLAAANAERDGDVNVAAKTLADAVCAPQSGEKLDYVAVRVDYTPDDVDGVFIRAEYLDQVARGGRTCSFAAFVPVAPKATLSGTATLTGLPVDQLQRPYDPEVLATAPLSGDVTTLGPVDGSQFYDMTADAKGDVIAPAGTATDTSRTITPKTTQQRYAAKTARNKAVSSARKAYVKASEKAGSSKSKEAAAKRTYLAKKKAANATYRTALEGTLTIKTTTSPILAASPFEFSIYGGCMRLARC